MNTNIWLTVGSFHALVLLIPVSLVTLYFRPGSWHILLGLTAGLLVGFINLHTDEVQVPAALLLLFGILLGFVRPIHAWLWALLIGVWVPVGQFVVILVNGHPGILQEGLGSFLAFAFSFAGSYMGAGIAALAKRASAGN